MSKKLTQQEFIKKCKTVHGDKYDYSQTIYTNALTKLIITCPQHGDFTKIPNKHIVDKQGCPECGVDSTKEKLRADVGEILGKFRQVHGDTYNYSKVLYSNYKDKVIIGCSIHGDFEKSPGHHLNGQGCPQCSLIGKPQHQARTLGEFLELAHSVHGDKYDYSNSIYINCKTPIEIICKKHGSFTIPAEAHTTFRSGCSACSHIVSRAQLEIQEFIESLGIRTERDFRLENNTEIDVYCPDIKIGFEHNGLFWHGEKRIQDTKYHFNKSLIAKEQGIHLIHIWEDEWAFDTDKVKNMISMYVGKHNKIYDARKCLVKQVSWEIAEALLNKVHLQGACKPTNLCYALDYEGSPVALMCFVGKEETTILTRFCSEGRVRGGFGKLLHYFISNNPECKQILSFSDNRWSKGGIYQKFGFKEDGELEPDYFWCKGVKRFHKRNFQHQYLSSKLENYNPEESEAVNCRNNGYFKIWDCGKTRWILDINK